MCKRKPFCQNSVWRGQLLCFLLHRHLGTGGSRNRIRHKLEFKKKPPWFEKTTPKNTQMPMREHKICSQEWVNTNLVLSTFWGCWPKPSSLWAKSIWCYSSAQDCEETLFQMQETSLHNTGCSTLLGKPLESTSGEGGAAAALVPRAKTHQAQSTECVPGLLSRSGALGSQVRGVWHGSNQANSKLQLKTHCVLEEPRHWNCLGNLTGFGAWSNCQNGKEIQLQIQERQKCQWDWTWERFMPKVTLWKDTTEEGFLPREQGQCPKAELSPRHHPHRFGPHRHWSRKTDMISADFTDFLWFGVLITSGTADRWHNLLEERK